MQQIVKKKLDEIMPYQDNPRNNDAAVSKVAESIKEFGFKVPIVIDKAGVIITGHTRYKAAKKLKLKAVPCIVADDLSPYQVKAFRVADNKVSEFSEWDLELLDKELDELGSVFDMSYFGFDVDKELAAASEEYQDKEQHAGALQDKYIVPPFSVLDTRKGYWNDRKRMWLDLGIASQDGRDTDLLKLDTLTVKSGLNYSVNGTSVFDPVLCEIVYKWFCPTHGEVYDPFAGGSVRGCVAEMLGYSYHGIDLRAEQIAADKANAAELNIEPEYICDDSLNADEHIPDDAIDLVFTCPPYFDLEIYSDDKRDISNMSYQDFKATYKKILKIAARKLKRDRFAVIVIADVRDKNGMFRGLPDLTTQIMQQVGLKLYNDLVLINRAGTAPLRAGRYFNANRKIAKLHQRVLVYFKGDPKKIKAVFPEIDFSDTEILMDDGDGK